MIRRFIANQFKRPSGFLGSLVGRLMERGNLPANQRILELLAVKDEDVVLEIGFGPGLALHQLLSSNPGCRAVGIDFSPLMLERATKRNAEFIARKRLELVLGDFQASRLGPGSFTKVYGVNVIYFWSDLRGVAMQLRSLLAPSGEAHFFMAHKDDLTKLGFTKTSVFNKYDIEDVTSALALAGFKSVTFTEASAKGMRAYFIKALA